MQKKKMMREDDGETWVALVQIELACAKRALFLMMNIEAPSSVTWYHFRNLQNKYRVQINGLIVSLGKIVVADIIQRARPSPRKRCSRRIHLAPSEKHVVRICWAR